MAQEGNDGLAIGEVLKRARAARGLDMSAVEEQTKIRVKYLRALENEDWGVLPNPAYAKGFLRTYAQILALDADALVDEFRRQVESAEPADYAYRVGEPVLESRRRPPGTGRGPWPLGLLLAAIAGVVVVALLVLGLVGGDDGGDRERGGRAERQERNRDGPERQPEEAPEPALATLRLVVNAPVEVCLLGAGGDVLIDDQLLNPGTEDSFEAESFEIRFPGGYDVEFFDLTIDGKRVRFEELADPAAFRISPAGQLRQLPAVEPGCP